MEKEPLLKFITRSPRLRPPPPLTLPPLPEIDDLSLPIPMTPSALKERLIFGPFTPSKDSASIVDALTLSQSSPRTPVPAAAVASCSNPDCGGCAAVGIVPTVPAVPPKSRFSKALLHRCQTAPAMAAINEISHHPPDPTPQFGENSVVRQTFILLVMYLGFGVLIYWIFREDFSVNQTHPIVDAFYFCIVTMCTIGYGDITPNSTPTKLFSVLFVLVGFGFIDILLSGMVSYVLDLQETYLLRNVGGKRGESTGNKYIIDVKKGRMRIRMKVGLALGVVVLCIGIGVAVMHFIEKLGWVDSLYLSVMSVTTVGYGDRAFGSTSGRIFASMWLLVSTLAVARAFLYLAEARVDKRQRRMAKWVLGHDMTVSEFLAADIDHNGYVRKLVIANLILCRCSSCSKSEYVIYKLKEMGKVTEKDVIPICQTFDRIDTQNLGKITLNDLITTHP
ncbi:Two-pore potassium channel 3 [Linum perenne]